MFRKTAMTLATTLFPLFTSFTPAGAIEAAKPPSPVTLDLKAVFESCPIIYSILILLSIGATVIWLYSLFTIKMDTLMPKDFMHTLRAYLTEKQYDEALDYCRREGNFASQLIFSGLSSRNYGPQAVIEAIRTECRRLGGSMWQKISLLNDIAVIAPMLGLLGTVLGLFFAFYDITSATENISSIFDGLGIAIGTTVLGLIVAIMAIVFYTILKYRIASILASIENESIVLVRHVNTDSDD